MFKFAILSFLVLVAFVAAYVPVAPKIMRVSSTALKAGYIPDGLTEAQWEALKAEKSKAMTDRKQKFKNKPFEDLTEWLVKRESKFPGQPGAGHRFAKVADKEPKKPDFSKVVSN